LTSALYISRNCFEFEFGVVLHYDILANLYEVSGVSEQFCKPR
jgi:hypothetical protein